jgi:hypothetical protein
MVNSIYNGSRFEDLCQEGPSGTGTSIRAVSARAAAYQALEPCSFVTGA